MKHTKGNWIITESRGKSNEFCFFTISTTEIDTIAYVFGIEENGNGGRDMAHKNVKLFFAAPDLLEACQNIENDDGNIPETIWNMIQSAIKKATE